MFADISKVSESSRPVSKPVIQEKQLISEEKLIADGRKIRQGHRILQKYEIESLMKNNYDAWQLYDKGVSRNKVGNILLYTGAGIIAVFAIISDNERLLGTMYGSWVAATPLIVGIVMKSKSKKDIEQSVVRYNRGVKLSVTELNFGFTDKGIGFGVKF